jgi:hypothetical protein
MMSLARGSASAAWADGPRLLRFFGGDGRDRWSIVRKSGSGFLRVTMRSL